MRNFTTTGTVEPSDDDAITFTVDGEELTAYPPTDGLMALTLAAINGRTTSTQGRTAAVIDFFVMILDDASAARLTERLLSRDDPFGLDEVDDILTYLIEEWTRRAEEKAAAAKKVEQKTLNAVSR